MRILYAIGMFLLITCSVVFVLSLFFGSLGFVIICLIGGVFFGKIWFWRCLVCLVVFFLLLGLVNAMDK